MPHSVSLITTIAAALGLALVLGLIAVRLRLPALVGYLVAGVIIGPATPGFVADHGAGAAARRDRRDAADVRRRPALLAQGSARSAPDRVARRHRADRRGHCARRADGHVVGLEPRRQHRVRPGAVGSQHGGAVAGARKPRPARIDQRSHRRRLAGGGRPRDGAGAGAAAGVVGMAGRQRRRGRNVATAIC